MGRTGQGWKEGLGFAPTTLWALGEMGSGVAQWVCSGTQGPSCADAHRPQSPRAMCVPHVLLPAGRTQTGALGKMGPHLACAMRGMAVVEFISRAVHGGGTGWGSSFGGGASTGGLCVWRIWSGQWASMAPNIGGLCVPSCGLSSSKKLGVPHRSRC